MAVSVEPTKMDQTTPDSATGGNADAVPTRPATPDEIIAMMDAAAEKKRETAELTRDEQTGGAWHVASFWLLWAGVFSAIGAIVYVVITMNNTQLANMVLVGGVLVLMALFLCGLAMKKFAPMLLAGTMLRRMPGVGTSHTAGLAGAEILTALGLAERVLDSDPDACLVTRLDGVVTYANQAYFTLAREAGVMGPSGLPPRIDRLFAQQGAEATKLFRLCRAAKSAAPAEEIIYQVIGLKDGGERRRFEVNVGPLTGSDDLVIWRLRNLPIEEEEHDALASAYADFPRAVFAIEKSGQIAWMNAALRDKLGVSRGAVHHIDEIVLGETSDLIRALWQIDRTGQVAQIRRHNADPAEGTFVAFRRGGIGEGFACIELILDESKDAVEDVSLSGDISEAPFGIAVVDGDLNKDARVIEANKAFTDVFGGSKKNTPLSRLVSNTTLDELASEIKRKIKVGVSPKPVETSIGTGAEMRTFAVYARPVRRKRGAYGIRRTLLYTVDVTDRKNMEESYSQDQKLRGIGELASKVAHDFNNYLQVVLGHCERLMLKHPAGDPAYQELIQIRENAQRAANTTKQLLAFSRKQTLKKEILSITEILRDFSRFLTRAIGEKVSLELINGRGLAPIKVDRYQFETAIMNLAVNARDAMGQQGGTLKISTQNIPADEIDAQNVAGLVEQDYVLIEIADTGPGVPSDIADKVFDPFFTTKETGKGTGLGLSTVYGIIRQMDGAIRLESTPGAGAVFKIYLPAYPDEEPVAPDATTDSKAREPQDLTGAGRILIVEDEDSVRTFVVATLTDCGYDVSEAEDGEDGLDVLEEEGDFDLVITDVMMPVMDGPSMIEKAREELDLKSKVIFMSAYAETAVREQLDGIKEVGYIQKPFSLKAIATQVKQTLYPPAEE